MPAPQSYLVDLDVLAQALNLPPCCKITGGWQTLAQRERRQMELRVEGPGTHPNEDGQPVPGFVDLRLVK